ncbi:MAG: hypothetical protein ABEJ56_01600 [Candidatus Nanohaloarchaea archaeon]
MRALHRIIGSTLVAILLTALSIFVAPEFNFTRYVVPLLLLGLLATLTLTSLAFYREDSLTLHDKDILMNGFLIAVLVPSFYTAGAFMHESATSWSGGEIHYHADYEVIVERNGELQTLDLIDPGKFCGDSYMCNLNDRTGITKYHEHNDNRIHLEGIFEKREDATLAAYFETFGGKLTNSKLVYPTNNGTVKVSEKDEKQLKVIVRKGTGGNRHWCIIGNNVPEGNICRDQYTGELANSPSEYVVSPHKKGPSLDDIFVIYDSSSKLEALQDLQKDGKYRGTGLSKKGEGF